MSLRWYARLRLVIVGWLVFVTPWVLVAPLLGGGTFGAGGVLLVLFGTWRGIAVRVRENDDGLRVRNVVRSYRLRWDDVTGVEWGSATGAVGFRAPVLTRAEGWPRRVPVLGMAAAFPTERDKERVDRWAERIAA
ncbi:MAG TPA: PH domain-containing protein [Mycobacteriales bacterium]